MRILLAVLFVLCSSAFAAPTLQRFPLHKELVEGLPIVCSDESAAVEIVKLAKGGVEADSKAQAWLAAMFKENRCASLRLGGVTYRKLLVREEDPDGDLWTAYQVDVRMPNGASAKMFVVLVNYLHEDRSS